MAHYTLLRRVLHVDQWSFARYEDRFFHGTNTHLRVYVRSKGSRQYDALALHRAEPAEAECYDICSRPEVDDSILTVAVRDDRTYAFDQGRTRRFHRDSRQDAPR